ncbi:MAG: hypothetical protein IPO32_19735 [Crocinitomicaceae bacterium]|nr:hypothetical protein [Crocinitomicaceae bacterium]
MLTAQLTTAQHLMIIPEVCAGKTKNQILNSNRILAWNIIILAQIVGKADYNQFNWDKVANDWYNWLLSK